MYTESLCVLLSVPPTFLALARHITRYYAGSSLAWVVRSSPGVLLNAIQTRCGSMSIFPLSSLEQVQSLRPPPSTTFIQLSFVSSSITSFAVDILPGGPNITVSAVVPLSFNHPTTMCFFTNKTNKNSWLSRHSVCRTRFWRSRFNRAYLLHPSIP